MYLYMGTYILFTYLVHSPNNQGTVLCSLLYKVHFTVITRFVYQRKFYFSFLVPQFLEMAKTVFGVLKNLERWKK